MNLIQELLKKRGIKNLSELDPAEKAIFDRWQKMLTTEDITIERLTEFIKEQKRRAEINIANPDNTKEKDMFLKASLNIYGSLLGLINSPKRERETIIKHLKQLLDQ